MKLLLIAVLVLILTSCATTVPLKKEPPSLSSTLMLSRATITREVESLRAEVKSLAAALLSFQEAKSKPKAVAKPKVESKTKVMAKAKEKVEPAPPPDETKSKGRWTTAAWISILVAFVGVVVWRRWKT